MVSTSVATTLKSRVEREPTQEHQKGLVRVAAGARAGWGWSARASPLDGRSRLPARRRLPEALGPRAPSSKWKDSKGSSIALFFNFNTSLCLSYYMLVLCIRTHPR